MILNTRNRRKTKLNLGNSKMKTVFVPIIFFICIYTSCGQQYNEAKSIDDSFFLDSPLDENPPEENHRYDELIERLFNGTPPPINLTHAAGPYDKFIFDPHDDESMSGTYRALLKLYFHHIFNETSSFSDVDLEEEIFWKMFKLTAAFLKYQHALHGNDTLAPDQNNKIHIYNSSEIDTETLLKDMLHYYQGLAAKQNESKIDYSLKSPREPIASRIKNKISSLWHKGINRFENWWNTTQIPSLRVKQCAESITQTGIKIIKSLFNKVTGFFKNVPPSLISAQYV